MILLIVLILLSPLIGWIVNKGVDNVGDTIADWFSEWVCTDK